MPDFFNTIGGERTFDRTLPGTDHANSAESAGEYRVSRLRGAIMEAGTLRFGRYRVQALPASATPTVAA